MLKIYLMAILVLSVSVQSIWAQTDIANSNSNNSSDNSTSTSVNWSGKILDQLLMDIGDELDDQGERLTATIFESLTDIELYEFGTEDFKLAFQIQRKVFDNHDITNTFTVVDFFRVPLSLPIPILSQGISGSIGSVGVHLGANLSISSMNIRQVLPKELESLPSLEKVKSKKKYIETLEDEDTFSTSIDDPFKPEEDEVTDEDRNVIRRIGRFLKWDTENQLQRARYSNILNLFTQPFKLPLTNQALRKMRIGEISSYKLDGSIQLGGTVGFSGLEMIGFPNLTAGVGLTTYLHGNYKFSVLKESETQVQLKVSKGRKLGYARSIGIGAPDHEIFAGVMVLGSNIGRIKESVVPFNLSINKYTAKEFDVGYRYDLTNPDAKQAYFKATFGMLKKSEELAAAKNGVTKIYTREQRTRARYKNYSMKLSLIYQKGHVTSGSQTSAVITINGEEHHLFKSLNVNSKGYATLWGDSESKRYQFSSVLDGEVFAEDKDKGFALKVEASVDDQFTTADEMKSYITEIVTMTGVDDLIIDFPKFDPEIKCENYELVNWARKPGRRRARGRANNHCFKRRDKAYFGKSKFFYRLNFTRKQIEKFSNYDEEKMWEILEIAFGINTGKWSSRGSRIGQAFAHSYASLLNLPLTIFDLKMKSGSRLSSARKFFKHWKSLKAIDDLEILSKTISKLFNTDTFSYEFLKVFKLTLEGEEVAYYMSAHAPKLFGTITKTGKVLEEVDTISGRASNLLEFDRVGSRINFNTSAVVKGLKVTQTSSREINIEFVLPKKPKFLFFRADKTSSWSSFKNLGKYVLLNENDQFVVGKNKIVISLDSNDRISKELAPKVFVSKYVTFMLAISFGDSGWGNISSDRIRVKSELIKKKREVKKQERGKKKEERGR
jgi:hypothetical protein